MRFRVSMTRFIFLTTVIVGALSSIVSAQQGNHQKQAKQPMTDARMQTLFNKWEKVWHEGRFDLVPECVGPTYIRHDESGDRTISREAYADEIAQIQKTRPGIRVVVYDHAFEGDRAWFRFAFKWADPETRESRTRAGMQSYRTENGKLVETWLSMQPLGSSWPDAVAQEHWTSLSPVQ